MRTDATEVLDAAIPVLAKDRGASMQSIARSAGISRATLVRLFPTRQQLVQAMAEKILDDCDRALTRLEASAAPVAEQLTSLVADYLPFGELWNLVYVEPDVLGLPEASERADAVFDRAVGFFRRAQGAGLLRQDMPAKWLTSTFCGLAETAWELTLEGDMGARQAPGFITEIMLRGAAA